MPLTDSTYTVSNFTVCTASVMNQVFVISLLICSSFWYHIYDDTSPLSLSLNVKMIRGSTMKDLLKISKPKTHGWENATVFIGNQPGGYKVSKV